MHYFQSVATSAGQNSKQSRSVFLLTLDSTSSNFFQRLPATSVIVELYLLTARFEFERSRLLL